MRDRAAREAEAAGLTNSNSLANLNVDASGLPEFEVEGADESADFDPALLDPNLGFASAETEAAVAAAAQHSAEDGALGEVVEDAPDFEQQVTLAQLSAQAAAAQGAALLNGEMDQLPDGVTQMEMGVKRKTENDEIETEAEKRLRTGLY
jgi:hypothetical protein